MSGDSPTTAEFKMPSGWTVFISLFPALVSFIVTLILILRSDLTFTGTDAATGTSLALIVAFALAGLAIGYGIRLLLPSPTPSPLPVVDGGHYRDRLARYVVTAGTIGIFVTALAIIVAVALRQGEDWVQTALSIFTSVLPVFSTWVGTVLAFYFTNESFRQAAAATQALAGVTPGGDQITRAGTMIGFEAITRLELDPAAVANQGAVAAAEAVALTDIETLFGPTGTNRVVIFDDKRQPVFVIRRGEMPPAVAATDTVKTYLDTGTNRVAAANFDRVASTLTIADARRLIESRRVTDLFVTQNGRVDEPTIGWVPDENLARV